MPKAARVCGQAGCPTITRSSRCEDHQRAQDAARGRRQVRGYDAAHDQLRRTWAKRIADGGVTCWRPDCGRPLNSNTPWHLGHDDHDRTRYRGPECASCNLAAAGRSRHA